MVEFEYLNINDQIKIRNIFHEFGVLGFWGFGLLAMQALNMVI